MKYTEKEFFEKVYAEGVILFNNQNSNTMKIHGTLSDVEPIFFMNCRHDNGEICQFWLSAIRPEILFQYDGYKLTENDKSELVKILSDDLTWNAIKIRSYIVWENEYGNSNLEIKRIIDMIPEFPPDYSKLII